MKSFDNLAVEQKAFEGATFAPIKRNVDELSRRIEVLERQLAPKPVEPTPIQKPKFQSGGVRYNIKIVREPIIDNTSVDKRRGLLRSVTVLEVAELFNLVAFPWHLNLWGKEHIRPNLCTTDQFFSCVFP